MAKGTVFYCWFVLPDNLNNSDLENFIDAHQKELDVEVESLALEKVVG